jgi:hypothetical protein
MAIVEEDSPFEGSDPACKCGCPIWDHLGGADGACVCGCPEYRAAPRRRAWRLLRATRPWPEAVEARGGRHRRPPRCRRSSEAQPSLSPTIETTA